MPGEEEDKDKGFTIRDRRRFTEQGEPREGEESPPAGAASAARDALSGGPLGPDPGEVPMSPAEPGAIDFTTFVFSLGSSALMHLGDAPHPETGQVAQSLELAQESIDILAMLQERTKGNLTAEEDRFLGALLYDLRLRFVQASRKK